MNYVNRTNQHGTHSKSTKNTQTLHYLITVPTSLGLFAVFNARHYVDTFLSLRYNRMSMTHG